MKQFVIAILAIALITGAAMAEKPKLPNDHTQIDINGGLSREGGDEPSSAVAITALPYNDSGDTSDNTAFMGGAPDVFYTFTPATETIVNIELCGSSFDTKLYLFDGAGSQVGYNDDACGLQSALYNMALNAGETYLIAVTGYGSASGAYVISVTAVGAPEPNSFCDLLSEASSELTGDTCDGENLVDGLTCASYNQLGSEDYYEVYMPAGSSFTAAVTCDADGSLSVVAECEALPGQFTCLAYADDTYPGGTEEVISYTNDTGSDAFVFLVIDSYGASCGAYTGTFESTGGAVSTEAMSLGEVKSLFR
jgi:hypothetical protein